MKKTIAIGSALVSLMVSTPAFANGVVVEGNGARSEGVWGAELGLGYELGAAGFSLRPIGGVHHLTRAITIATMRTRSAMARAAAVIAQTVNLPTTGCAMTRHEKAQCQA